MNPRAPAYTTAGVIAAAFVFSMAINWPGHLSYDSVIQLLEGRTAAYSGWHPPVMSWLLGLSDAVGGRAAAFMLGTAALMFAALASVPWIASNASWWGLPAALLCAFLPQLALYQAIVWKDVLFANAVVAAFILLAHTALHWSNRRARLLLLTAAAACLVLAALARQNGIVLLPFAAAALGWIATRYNRGKGAAITTALIFALCVLTGWFGGRALLAERIVGDRGEAKQMRLLEFYDLNGAIAAQPTIPIPDLQKRDPHLLHLMRREGPKVYSAARSDYLARSAALQAALADAPDDILHRSWRDYIVRHPLLYLRNRAEVFRWVLLTPKMEICVPFVVGLRGPAEVLTTLGVHERVDARDRLLERYGTLFVGTPVFSHMMFLLLSLAELAFLLWRRRTPDLAFCALLLGSIGFAVSFFFLSIACDYRYLYLLDIAALATLIYVAASTPVLRGSALMKR